MKTLQLYLLVGQQFFLMYGSVKSLFPLFIKEFMYLYTDFLSFFPPDSARDGSSGVLCTVQRIYPTDKLMVREGDGSLY